MTVTHVDRRDRHSERKGDQQERSFDTPDDRNSREDVGEDAEGGRQDGHGETPVGEEPVETWEMVSVLGA